jgi:hypothetical protein
LLERLAADHGGKRVESGHNLLLWRPYDRSVFANFVVDTDEASDLPQVPVTSALQTYLDLKRTIGRSEEASQLLFDKYLRQDFQQAETLSHTWLHGEN